MKKYTDIPPEVLHDLLSYDKYSGHLIWKPRKGNPQWNGANAGNVAFTAEFVGGYKHGSIFSMKVRAHRVVWAMHHGEWPSGEIDHINGNPRDNRIENLRVADRTDQARNCKLQANNKSGHVGVFWHKKAEKWTAQICQNRKAIHLGLFNKIEDAVSARKAAATKLGYHKNHGAKR